jgi:hypothetical protein
LVTNSFTFSKSMKFLYRAKESMVLHMGKSLWSTVFGPLD